MVQLKKKSTQYYGNKLSNKLSGIPKEIINTNANNTAEINANIQLEIPEDFQRDIMAFPSQQIKSFTSSVSSGSEI